MIHTIGEQFKRSIVAVTCFIAILIVSFPPILSGQTTGSRSTLHHQWLTLEAGGTAIGPALGVMLSDYNPANNNLVNLRGLLTFKITGYIPADMTINQPDDGIWEAGLMFGKGLQGDYYFISASAGLSIVGGVKSSTITRSGSYYDQFLKSQQYYTVTSYDNSYFRTIGIPIQLQFHFIPIRFIGIGLEGVANVNTKYSTYGVLISVQIGGLILDP